MPRCQPSKENICYFPWWSMHDWFRCISAVIIVPVVWLGLFRCHWICCCCRCFTFVILLSDLTLDNSTLIACIPTDFRIRAYYLLVIWLRPLKNILEHWNILEYINFFTLLKFCTAPNLIGKVVCTFWINASFYHRFNSNLLGSVWIFQKR